MHRKFLLSVLHFHPCLHYHFPCIIIIIIIHSTVISATFTFNSTHTEQRLTVASEVRTVYYKCVGNLTKSNTGFWANHRHHHHHIHRLRHQTTTTVSNTSKSNSSTNQSKTMTNKHLPSVLVVSRCGSLGYRRRPESASMVFFKVFTFM